MFWRIANLNASSPVEFILDKESFTLEELLDEEEIIQECKALNTRLINFLRDRAQVEQLLKYIVRDAPEDADSRRAFKFPFIACEIFTCEIDVILKTLVENEDLMDMLFSFLEPNHTHSSILAGYFSKVVVCLMLRKTTLLMKYVQAHDVIFHQLVDLIGITSIMEILIRLVGVDDHMYPNYLDIMQWLADSNLLEMIVDKLSPMNSPEVHANAAEVLLVIIRNAPSALADKLSNQSFVSRIFAHALEHSSSKSSLVQSLSVCIALLDPRRSNSAAWVQSIRIQHMYEQSIHVVPETILAMLPKLGDLLKLLSLSCDASVLPSTYGELHPPLGKHRLKIVEFIAVLLETGNEDAEKELIVSGAIKRILDLFFEYPYNNSLHHHVERLVVSCLESKHIDIIDHLFCECGIIGKFLQAEKSPFLSSDLSVVTVPAAGRKPPKAGNIGHITRICNKLVQLGNNNDCIQSYLQESEEWADWETSVLSERNVVENVYRWACGRPTTVHEKTRDSDEDELHDNDYDVAGLANNLSQAFRYNAYENGEMDEAHGSIDRDDEDIYFDNGSAEVLISPLRLGGGGVQQSFSFTNSNWFAFQDERITEPMGTAALDTMDDIDLNGCSGNSSDEDEVVVGTEELTKVENLEKGHSSSKPLLKNNVEEFLSEGSTEATKSNLADDVSLFKFDTTDNEDLFNDQSVPEWVGWHEPSDIHVDGSSDLSTTSISMDTALGTISVGALKAPEGEDTSGVLETGELAKTESTPCSLEEGAEIGVELAGVGRAVERSLGEGINGGEVGALKRNFHIKVPELPEAVDDASGMEFSKSHWRAEPEMGVVQE